MPPLTIPCELYTWGNKVSSDVALQVLLTSKEWHTEVITHFIWYTLNWIFFLTANVNTCHYNTDEIEIQAPFFSWTNKIAEYHLAKWISKVLRGWLKHIIITEAGKNVLFKKAYFNLILTYRSLGSLKAVNLILYYITIWRWRSVNLFSPGQEKENNTSYKKKKSLLISSVLRFALYCLRRLC